MTKDSAETSGAALTKLGGTRGLEQNSSPCSLGLEQEEHARA